LEPTDAIECGHSSAFKDDTAAVSMQVDGLNAAKRLSSCHDGGKQVLHATGFVRRHQIERCFADYFFRFISEDIVNFRAAVSENPLLIDFPNPIACCFQQQAKPLLASLQSQFRATSLFLRWFYT
jgi:hypothetical protein